MKNRMVNKLKATAVSAALMSGFLVSTPAFADQVALKSADGTVNLVGEFVEFKDDNYVIRTALGNLRISASRVRCEGEACPNFDLANADVAIAGSDEIGLGMMPLLMSGYAASLAADTEFNNTAQGKVIATLIGDDGFGDEIGSYLVSTTDDNDAFAALLEERASVGMSARRISKDEARALRAAGAGNMVSPNQEHIVAVDSMVVITHPSNPVKELSVEQLRGIFTGQITNWRDIGGPDHPINVISMPEDSSSYKFFMNYLFEGTEAEPTYTASGVVNDFQEMSSVVYLDQNAIGYVGQAFQRGAQPVTLINECGLAAVPDAFSAKTEEYDLSRRMYLYNRSDKLDDLSKNFLDFVTSSEADGVIGKSGFIDLGILRRSQDLTDNRATALAAEAAAYDAGFEAGVIQEMLDKMAELDRLSTTFRFRTGSSRVDERGRLDMDRLISYLERVPSGTKVSFVGFTDDVGAFEANRRLSETRADAVMEEVANVAGGRLDHLELSTLGFGEIAPSACNVNERGRGINRRVEVWISKDA